MARWLGRRRLMNVRHSHDRLRALYYTAMLLFSTLLVLALAISGSSYTEPRTNVVRSKKAVTSNFLKDGQIQPPQRHSTVTGSRTGRRRYLSVPGSSPPRCTSKCGRCTPCKPVHVPVPPGNAIIAEYYPEAWRCKCGNKLYMP